MLYNQFDLFCTGGGKGYYYVSDPRQRQGLWSKISCDSETDHRVHLGSEWFQLIPRQDFNIQAFSNKDKPFSNKHKLNSRSISLAYSKQT